jgi:hypothetical protein
MTSHKILKAYRQGELDAINGTGYRKPKRASHQKAYQNGFAEGQRYRAAWKQANGAT